MSRPLIRIHNIETDEIIDREMNDEEFAEYENAQKVFNEEAALIASAQQAKSDLLARLGITEEEAKLLLGGN